MRLAIPLRTLSTRYAAASDGDMLKPDTLLSGLVNRYLESALTDLDWKTIAPYRSRLNAWLRYLREANSKDSDRAESEPTLADFLEPNAARWVKLFSKHHVNDARNKAIAIRAFGTWLAMNRYWYAGSIHVPLSFMAQLVIPKIPPKGRPIYGDDDIETIRHAADEHPTRPYFLKALQMLDELGPRTGVEAMTLRIDDVFPPMYRTKGKVTITREHTKSDHGARNIPLEPAVYRALEDYVAYERPRYSGDDPTKEPLFLTVEGKAYAYSGWAAMRRRFKDFLRRFDPDLEYQPSRLRGTRAYKLRRAGYTDSEINQIMGWGAGSRMLMRYSGELPDEHFDGRPNTTGELRHTSAPRTLRSRLTKPTAAGNQSLHNQASRAATNSRRSRTVAGFDRTPATMV